MGIIIDPIADMLVRIKNANQRKYNNVKIPYSKIKENITKIILKHGFILRYVIEGKGTNKIILINLKYKGNQKAITGVKRISKPGLRVYAEKTNIPMVLSGFGISIISTSRGLIIGKEARRQNVGGEVLAYIW